MLVHKLNYNYYTKNGIHVGKLHQRMYVSLVKVVN